MDNYNLLSDIADARKRPNPYRKIDPNTAFLLDLLRLVEIVVRRAVDEHEQTCHKPHAATRKFSVGGVRHGSA